MYYLKERRSECGGNTWERGELIETRIDKFGREEYVIRDYYSGGTVFARKIRETKPAEGRLPRWS